MRINWGTPVCQQSEVWILSRALGMGKQALTADSANSEVPW